MPKKRGFGHFYRVNGTRTAGWLDNDTFKLCCSLKVTHMGSTDPIWDLYGQLCPLARFCMARWGKKLEILTRFHWNFAPISVKFGQIREIQFRLIPGRNWLRAVFSGIWVKFVDYPRGFRVFAILESVSAAKTRKLPVPPANPGVDSRISAMFYAIEWLNFKDYGWTSRIMCEIL